MVRPLLRELAAILDKKLPRHISRQFTTGIERRAENRRGRYQTDARYTQPIHYTLAIPTDVLQKVLLELRQQAEVADE